MCGRIQCCMADEDLNEHKLKVVLNEYLNCTLNKPAPNAQLYRSSEVDGDQIND
jgi:hypothetical protein